MTKDILDLIKKLQEPKTTISCCKRLRYIDADLAMKAAQVIVELQQKLETKYMLDAIREAGSDNYTMSPQEAEALFGENASKPKPKVEPKSLPRKDLR